MSSFPSDAEVRRILAERVGDLGQYYGIVVGLVDASGRRIISHGNFGKPSTRALDENTLFELGSISKVFTSLLLMLSVERGEVALDDPLAKHLPPGTKVPSFQGRPITLRDLATHTSGLPRVPTNLIIQDPNDPYANYTVENLYEFLASHELERAPGSEYRYSNLGAALLARALIVRTGQSYAELIGGRIAGPLVMRHTWVDIPAGERASLATGHTQVLHEAPLRTRIAMIGNGGVFSSADDLLTFLGASMGLVDTPLASAFERIATPQRSIDDKGGAIGFGWHILTTRGSEIVWHNGGTAGFRTFAAYDRSARTGVVVLTNCSTPGGVDDIGLHLIAKAPLSPVGDPEVSPTRPRQQVTIDPRLLDQYVGVYQLKADRRIRMTREKNHLVAELKEGSRLPLFPESEETFFSKLVDLTFRFERDAEGKVVAVSFRAQGQELRMPRVPAPEKKPGAPPRE